MLGYAPDAFAAFFTAMIAAAAALTGLLFVAVSINFERLLKGSKYLLARAAETMAILLLVVVSSALALIPQNVRLMGVEIVVVVVPMIALIVRSQLSQLRKNRDDPLLWSVSRMTCTAAATVPCTVAGLSLALHAGGGFYWLVPTALLGIAGAVYNAWVLLIEIAR